MATKWKTETMKHGMIFTRNENQKISSILELFILSFVFSRTDMVGTGGGGERRLSNHQWPSFGVQEFAVVVQHPFKPHQPARRQHSNEF